jgi:glyoxylase-like metal-dependent hydrolase (beta-lactamase superfamily II)
MGHDTYEVYALRYAERPARVRADSFLFDDHEAPHPIDYFLWVLRNERRIIVVDTGYDRAEGDRRGRPILREPGACLADFGIAADSVETVILTHLHYDHAGALDQFPAARFHLQSAEMAFATGSCMCERALNHPFSVRHVCRMVEHVYAGRVQFHDGDAEVAPGVEVFATGGHSLGLQAVRARTVAGWLVLASDAAHFYENFAARKLFPIMADPVSVLRGYDRLAALASRRELIVPGHDPMVCEMFPKVAGERTGASVYRLDKGPVGPLARYLDGFAS